MRKQAYTSAPFSFTIGFSESTHPHAEAAEGSEPLLHRMEGSEVEWGQPGTWANAVPKGECLRGGDMLWNVRLRSLGVWKRGGQSLHLKR